MKLYIRTDGSLEIGLGHLVRCLALAQMLKPKFSIIFMCKYIPEKIKKDIEKEGFTLEEIQFESTFFAKLKHEDIVVLDGYQFDNDYQIKIKEKKAILVCIDDLHDKDFVADVIINHAPSINSKAYKSKKETQFLLGPEYVLLRPLFLQQAKMNRIVLDVETVLICFGGSDFKNLTKSVLETVLHFNEFKKIIVITGAAYSSLLSLQPLINSDSRIFHYHAVGESQMLDLMKETDLAIVPSSGILNEVLAAGCKVISGMYVDNQKFIYQAYKDAHCFYDAVNFDSKDLKKAIVSAFESTKNTKNPIDGKSGERILSFFDNLSMANQLYLHEVSIDDAVLLFHWANDMDVRRNAFNEEPIIWENHIKWLESKLKDLNSKIFILKDNNLPVGQIRIDLEDNYWVIDYSIDKEYRGKGYGEKIVSLLIQNYESYKFRAIVKKNNLASNRVFEKLNFQIKALNESNINVYEYNA